jgi:hypothetical protein
MKQFEALENKVRLAAQQLTKMKNEYNRLKSQLDLVEEENKHAKEILRQNSVLQDQKKAAYSHLEKLFKKLKAINVQ